MVKRVQMIGHITSAADLFIGKLRELSVDITKKTVRVHDGVTPGGTELAKADLGNVVAATTGNDGKMTAAQAVAIATNTGDINTLDGALVSHIGAGGAVHAAASGATAGFMSAADKTKLDGIEAGAGSNPSASEILAALLTVDGAGSGLDADLLDGLNQTEAATGNTIMRRDAAGRAKVTDPSAASDIATKSYVDSATGAVSVFAAGDYKVAHKRIDHGKWLLCDGRVVSRTGKAALFAEIGTTHGVGDGSTTFNLPDGRAKNIIMENVSALPNGADGTRTTRTRGEKGGDEDAVVVTHTHGNGTLAITGGGHEHTESKLGTGTKSLNESGGTLGDPTSASTTGGGAHSHGITGAIANAGVSGAEANMPPFICIGNLFIYEG